MRYDHRRANVVDKPGADHVEHDLAARAPVQPDDHHVNDNDAPTRLLLREPLRMHLEGPTANGRIPVVSLFQHVLLFLPLLTAGTGAHEPLRRGMDAVRPAHDNAVPGTVYSLRRLLHVGLATGLEKVGTRG